MSEKRINYDQWRKDLQPFWEKKISGGYFVVKPAYTIKGAGPFVRVLRSELEKGDIYCEFINLNEELYHKDRRLYKLDYNPNYAAKYDMFLLQMADFKPVAVTDSKKISIPSKPEKASEQKMLPPVMGISARDLFAIIHKIPVADNEDINELIHKYI